MYSFDKINVGIIGAAGYTGGELIRLLINHPKVNIVFVHSKSNAGNAVHSVHQDLVDETDLIFTNKVINLGKRGILFLCLGHGESTKFLQQNTIDDEVKIIDLANDFRLQENAISNNRTFVYGLPELHKNSIATAKNIANPGCFATAIQLGLLPLAKAGLLQNIYTTGITGSTGAGQSLAPTAHFSWRSNNIQAYKTLTHQHNAEILQTINTFYNANNSTAIDFNFVPWRGDFARGIFISTQLKCTMPIDALYQLYKNYYTNHPFVHLSKAPIFLKQVVNTNKCCIQLEMQGNTLVVHTVIDNLIKGASGQAIQNMNILFGLDETTGLKLKANYF
jgi:N-acetyl-gamma-glutamyl-phosphate reductase